MHDVYGEAHDLQRLGAVHLHRRELDKASQVFKRAVELHKQAHDVIGEVRALEWLAEIPSASKPAC